MKPYKHGHLAARNAAAQALRYARDFWGPRVSRACTLDTAWRWARAEAIRRVTDLADGGAGFTAYDAAADLLRAKYYRRPS